MGIRIDSVTKTYEGKAILKNISLEIEDGTFTTILGASDAGKTTLLRIMSGIGRPDRGKIYYNDEDVTHLAMQKRPVAMVYQQFVNYPSMTVYDNIASPLRVSETRHTKAEIDKKVRENAELLGLTQVLDHHPEEISGGQKQRTAIARALAKEAQFTFLDEPLANLDYKLREELRGELKNILRQKGGVVIYATPEPADALSMATHVGYLQEGELLQFGRLEEVYRHPRLADVGTYFSYPTMNILESELVSRNGGKGLRISDELEVDVTEFQDKLHSKQYLVGVRAYNLKTQKEREDMLPLKAVVTLSEELGSDTELHLDYHGVPLVVLIQEFVRHPIGKEVEIFLDPKRLFIFDKRSRELVVKTYRQ